MDRRGWFWEDLFMFYVYLLQNERDAIYIGYSADLQERLKAHQKKKPKYTRKSKNWRLVYYEAFQSEQDAKEREQTLKNYGSTLGQLKKRIRRSLTG